MISAPDTDTMYHNPQIRTVYELVRYRAGSTPEQAAILAPGRRPLTYACLLYQVERAAEALRISGLDRNDRVAVVLPNGPEMAVACIAIAACAVCVPLNPAYRSREFDFYLGDLNANGLVLWSGMDSPARDVARRRGIPVIDLVQEIEAPAGAFRLISRAPGPPARGGFARPENVALALHTSGTTSRPKIVPLTQANICSSGHHISVTLGLKETDRCLNVMPLFHIHGLIGAVLASLAAGASVVCTPGFDAGLFFEWMDTHKVTWYTAVPTIHQAVLARARANREAIARRPLRFIRSSSAALPKAVLTEMEDVFNTSVIESYGMTEASHQMTSNPLAPAPRKLGSVGVAAGPDVAIMDAAGNLLPTGAVGEVVIRGENVTLGYENNVAANQSSFTRGWFRTGDQGYFDHDGYLYLTGRLKEIINRGGEKVAPKEVDEVLSEHPAVAQAIAFAVPHPTLGEDVAAAVVLKPNVTVAETDIVKFAAARLADFKVPKQILFVNEIPKGPTGKLQRIGLADTLADQLASKSRATFEAAETPIEKVLANIWKDVLKTGQVGVQDSFYALGGDSLALAVMLSEVEGQFGQRISLDSFLNSPTINTIAHLLQANELSSARFFGGTTAPQGSGPIRDSVLIELKNRLLQLLALYVPGLKTVRVWLHRMRGVSIGKNVFIGLSTIIETAHPQLVFIGNNVTIGVRTVISAYFRSTKQAIALGQHTVRIEDDVYIGPGVIILPNVTIGRGAVVSAGSVVSRSVPANTLVRGNPAIPIAHCGIPLCRNVSYEEFVRHLIPIRDDDPSLPPGQAEFSYQGE